MAHRSSFDRPPSLLERLAIVSLGLYLAAVGAQAMAGGHLIYRNYVYTPVLAPIALAIGVVLIGAGVAMRQ